MSSLKFILSISLLFIYIIFRPINAQVIFVSGHISNNTSWADTVKITGNIIIDNGITLTVDPGTYIESQGHYNIDIKGCIIAIGNQSDSICFTINDTTGFSNFNSNEGSWAGFLFQNTLTTNDTSRFEFCRIQYCKKFMSGTNEGAAFLISGYSKIKILHCKIYKHACSGNGGAISIHNSDPLIMFNIIERNYSGYHGGAVCYWTDAPININFSNNILIYNKALQ